MSPRPMFIAAALIEGAGRYVYVIGCRLFKASRVYATELRMLSNYRIGILRYQKPVDVYRRIFFEALFLLIAIFGCFYSSLRYFIQPSYSVKFSFSFIQPLHRFIGGEPFSIFWRKELWYVSEFFYSERGITRPNRLHPISRLHNLIMRRN